MTRWIGIIFAFGCLFAEDRLVIGSKLHTESHLLAEALAQVIESETDLQVVRKFRLGGTLLIYKALENGDIDIYPEYTGTIEEVILKKGKIGTTSLAKAMADRNLYVSQSMGFNNTYALAIRQVTADELAIEKISDLISHPQLRWGLTHEFLHRSDGLPGLRQHYGFGEITVAGLDKALHYQALSNKEVDVVDAYSTDGRLNRYQLKILEDDRQFFPKYLAVWLARLDVLEKHPQLIPIMARFEGVLDDNIMRSFNARIDVQQEIPENTAGTLLSEVFHLDYGRQLKIGLPWLSIWRKTVRHLQLTGVALFFSVLVGVSFGMVLIRQRHLIEPLMLIVGTIQTIPSLALLAFMIPLLGIGFLPAVVALFLYGLLPIMRNTVVGLNETPPATLDAAMGLGLSEKQVLMHVRLPLAVATILGGVRTSAVVSIGTATLAAFIGAGGLGDFILTGLSLNDNSVIMQGAIPAAILAILTDRLLAIVQWYLTPLGIRQQQGIG